MDSSTNLRDILLNLRLILPPPPSQPPDTTKQQQKTVMLRQHDVIDILDILLSVVVGCIASILCSSIRSRRLHGLSRVSLCQRAILDNLLMVIWCLKIFLEACRVINILRDFISCSIPLLISRDSQIYLIDTK